MRVLELFSTKESYEVLRNKLVDLMLEYSVFEYVRDSEIAGVLKINKEGRAKYLISRNKAREISRILVGLGVFKFSFRKGFYYLGNSTIFIIWDREHI